MARLQDLPEPHRSRVSPAQDAAPWATRCISAHAASWVAWNVCEDAWYGAAELDRVVEAIDRATAGLSGPNLLMACAGDLQALRVMSPNERDLLPAHGVNHLVTQRFRGKYDLAPESDAMRGSAPGELDPTLLPGTRLRLIPRATACLRWVTFDVPTVRVPREPDDLARTLALDWDPALGNVVRVEVPIDTLRRTNAPFAIPTLFDVIHDDPRYPLKPDWRARPEPEHHPDQPWGHARDMRHGGPALPEILVDITAATKMDAEILGPVTSHEWATRPFLTGSAPR